MAVRIQVVQGPCSEAARHINHRPLGHPYWGTLTSFAQCARPNGLLYNRAPVLPLDPVHIHDGYKSRVGWAVVARSNQPINTASALQAQILHRAAPQVPRISKPDQVSTGTPGRRGTPPEFARAAFFFLHKGNYYGLERTTPRKGQHENRSTAMAASTRADPTAVTQDNHAEAPRACEGGFEAHGGLQPLV